MDIVKNCTVSYGLSMDCVKALNRKSRIVTALSSIDLVIASVISTNDFIKLSCIFGCLFYYLLLGQAEFVAVSLRRM